MANENTPSWEERVMQLEASVTDLRGQLSASVEERAALSAQLTAASAALDAHKQAERARADQEFAAYVGDLKAQATQAGSAVPEDKLDLIRQTYEGGNVELAKTLGSAYLDLAKATGGGNVNGATSRTVSLGSTSEDTKCKADYAAETRARWGRG